jgi:dTDP-4-amino-4,6-dideoxygalactose transaminase
MQFKHHNGNMKKRKNIADFYRNELTRVKGISVLPEPENTESNFAYFPILVNEKEYA